MAGEIHLFVERRIAMKPTDHQPPRANLGKVAVFGMGTIAGIFLGLPLIVLVVRGLAAGSSEGVAEAVVLSLITTLITSALTILFGTPLAYALARRKMPFRPLVQVLVELPIVLPPAVAGLALLLTFGRRGLLGPVLGSLGITLPFTTAAVVFAQTFVSAPFFIRSALVGFQHVPREIEDAARVDGAAGWSLFCRVTLPLASRALLAGLILSWARALGEFGATILFAGSTQGRTQTMPLLIYNILERNLDAAIFASLILLGLALVALLISQWFARGSLQEHTLV
jgi:molybdate transport system permease protein